jgi:AcrR family transcriptional regulator
MGVQDRKAREFQRREREILAAALALFRRPDWQGVTIDEIAARAEIGKGTVYKHFETKDEIYARLAVDFYRGLVADLRRIDPDTDLSVSLKAMIRVFWEAHLALPPEYRRVVQYCERPDFLERLPRRTREAMREASDEVNAIVTGFLERAMAAGALARKPMAQLTYVLQAAVLGAIRMAWTGCVPQGQEALYLDEITEFVVAGLLDRSPARVGAS